MAKKKTPKIVKEIQLQPKPEIDYSYQKNISFSQFSMYSKCPQQWAFQYKDKLKEREYNLHLVFGSAIHTALQHYLDIMYSKSAAQADREDIEGLFKEEFIKEYQSAFKSNNNTHFSSPDEMREFHQDGLEIIKTFKKQRSKHFTKRGWHLVGCEVPILIPPMESHKNILYMGYLDVVMYNENTNKFLILDIKTSTSGWNKWAKQDEMKQFQLVLYKKFFAQQYGVEINDIDVEFFIVKRKLPDYAEEYFLSRIQTFKPASGKVKINKATRLLENFIQEAFTSKGKIIEKDYQANPSKWNCKFCAFNQTCSSTFQE